MTAHQLHPPARRPSALKILRSASESAIYGVVLVAGLVVITADGTDASWRVLLKVLATLLVFWLAHVYAGVVAHLGDRRSASLPAGARVRTAVRDSLVHSWGMLLAGLIPVAILALGVVKVLSDTQAMWGTLWVAVAVLGSLGWLGVAAWTPRTGWRVAGAAATSLLGVVLVALKVWVH